MNENSLLNSIIPEIISSAITIIGFVITILINRYNLKKEVSKHHKENYRDKFKDIEYDVAEVLQLSAEDYFTEKSLKFPYDIQIHRDGEFKETRDTAERLYRLGGYISTYGSAKAVKYLNLLKQEFYKFINADNEKTTDKKEGSTDVETNKLNENTEYCNFIALLALFITQVKADIFNKVSDDFENDALNWLQLRLPVDTFNKCEKTLKEVLSNKKLNN